MTVVTKLHFQKLKRLENVTVELPEKGVVALMGENGTGKTTVLHALACLYKPHQQLQIEQGDHGGWWTDWFVPHTGNLWNNSKLTAFFTDSQVGVDYKKGGDRWSPRKSNRRQRYCRYIGFKDCMPDIEKENLRSRFQFNLHPIGLSAAKRERFLNAARTILNRTYQDIQRATKNYGLGNFLYATVTHGNPAVATSYTSHYMGAGEQKVLKIIEEIVRAPNGGIVLFEEFEVAIHESALRRLIPWLVQEAENHSLQIIVSTHWPRMTEFAKDVHLRTLHSTPTGGVACINGFRPSTMHRLTGDMAQLRLITIWVEDTLAAKIVEQIAAELGLLANITTKGFGAAVNAFAVAAALELDGADLQRNLVVLDGDCYRRVSEKRNQINSTLTGTGQSIEATQLSALRWFAQFCPVTSEFASPTDPMKPERFLLEAAMRTYQQGQGNSFVEQFFNFAAENVFQDPDKSLIYEIGRHFNLSLDRVELILIDAARLDPTWHFFRLNVREQLISMATALNLELKQED